MGDQDFLVIASAPNFPDELALASLVMVDGPDGSHPMCHYLGGLEPCIGGDGDPDTDWPDGENTAAGYQPPPTPPTCGPSDDEACWE